MSSQYEGNDKHFTKITVMFLAVLCDLALSSTLDFDTYNNENNGQLATRLILGLYGLQVTIQISIFLVLFLAMADTFLFRVGLLYILLKKFRFVLGFHVINMAITVACGAYRVRKFIDNWEVVDLMRDSTFVGLSLTQKIVAIPYYVLNIRAVVKLSANIYFNKDMWIALIKKNSKLAQRRVQ
jgi:hypothetical protein